MNQPPLETYLTEDEKKRLTDLRTLAEKAQTEVSVEYHPLRMTLPQLAERWTFVHTEIIKDLITWSASFSGTYRIYFSDIEETKSWLEGIQRIIVDLSRILIRGDRGIYFGITCILVFLLLWSLSSSQ
jgi:hypothetical protein